MLSTRNRRGLKIGAIVAVAAVTGAMSVLPAGARPPSSNDPGSLRAGHSILTPMALKALHERAPAAANRAAAASATLFKTCVLRVGKRGTISSFLSLAKDNIGPFGIFEFFEPAVTHLEFVDLIADLETVRITKLNKCVAKGSGDWGKVNVRSSDPGRKRTQRFGCVKFISKRSPWTGKVVFKSGLTPLQAGRFAKTKGTIEIFKVVSIDGCEPDPGPTDCELPLQMQVSSPDENANPSFVFLAAKDQTGFVTEAFSVQGLDAGSGLLWAALLATGDTDDTALTGDALTGTGSVKGIAPFVGTGTFSGAFSNSQPTECGGSTDQVDGALSGDLAAETLMGTFSAAAPGSMFVHSGP